MSKRCTTCGDGLTFWDCVLGRTDHPECWEKCIVKLPPNNNEAKLPLLKPDALLKVAQIFSRSAPFSR